MQTERKIYEANFDAGVNKVVHGVPYDEDLIKTSDIQLFIYLEQSPEGSARRSVIAKEIEKRKTVSCFPKNGVDL